MAELNGKATLVATDAATEGRRTAATGSGQVSLRAARLDRAPGMARSEVPRESTARSRPVIERVSGPEGFSWNIEPYATCAFECVGCPVEVPGVSEGRGHAQAHAVLLARLRDMAARGDRTLGAHPVVLGAHADPWQPAERALGRTRQILEALVAVPELSVVVRTRSSLVGRDADVLGQLARRGRVRVTVVLPTLSRRLWSLLEPASPSPERRLMAVGILARAGLEVGVEVGPLIHGVNDDDSALRRLLSRARDAGAGGASFRALPSAERGRDGWLSQVAARHPDRAAALGRLASHARSHGDPGAAALAHRFSALCAEVGLANGAGAFGSGAHRVANPPRQLSLF